MNYALLTMYIICGIALLFGAYLHGKPKPEDECKYNFFNIVTRWIIRFVFVWWALGWRFI